MGPSTTLHGLHAADAANVMQPRLIVPTADPLSILPQAWRESSDWGPAGTRRLLTAAAGSLLVTLLNPYLLRGVFFPLEERLAGVWLWIAEATPLLHPVRLARMAFAGHFETIGWWDLAYIAGVTTLLLGYARRTVRARLTS